MSERKRGRTYFYPIHVENECISFSVQTADAVIGTRLRVPTLDGDVQIKVPPGTQPNEILRLRGEGLPRFDRKGKGDINVRIQLQLPEKITPEEQKLFQQLRDLQQKTESKGI